MGGCGPRERLGPKRRALAARYGPFAHRLIGEALYRLGIPPDDHRADDVRSLAFATLAEAAGDFDRARGVRFASYVSGTFRHRVGDYVRACRARRPPDDPPGPGTTGPAARASRAELQRARAAENDRPPGDWDDQVDAFEARIAAAPPACRELARLRFLDGYTLAGAAGVMGLSRGRACHLMRRLAAAVPRRP